MSNNKPPTGNLIWIDLEMTGLDPATDEIIEMAIVATNRNLEIIAESDPVVFSCADSKLDAMDAWNTSTHTKSGLVEDVKASKVDYKKAEQLGLDFLKEFVIPGESPMCGNTICQDRRFIARHLPDLHNYFHYRNFDVTTFKLACSYWTRNKASEYLGNKQTKHRALNDIIESIEEMRYYHSVLFT